MRKKKPKPPPRKTDPRAIAFRSLKVSAAQRQQLRRLPYHEFLLTVYWRIVSDEAKRRAHDTCALCSNRLGLQTHHRTYEHHGREDQYLRDLIVLCPDCHKRHHGKLVPFT